MDFFEVVNARHSIRAFAATPLEGEKLHKILETANRAPSAGNLQAYEIYVVTHEIHRAALARAASDQEFLTQAPAVLVFCTHPARSKQRYSERGERLYCIQDATIACTFAMLAAAALGLSSVWVGAFDDEAVRHTLGAPQGVQPVAMLPIGYAAEQPQLTARRALNDLVHRVA